MSMRLTGANDWKYAWMICVWPYCFIFSHSIKKPNQMAGLFCYSEAFKISAIKDRMYKGPEMIAKFWPGA